MRFRTQCADRHCRTVKAFIQIFCSFYLFQFNRRCIISFQTQQVSQHSRRTVVNCICIATVTAIVSGIYGRLQCIHYLRIIGMILTLRLVFQITADFQSAAFLPCPLVKPSELIIQLGKCCTFNPVNHILKA